MKLTFFPKLIIVALFVGICLTGMYLHSERWNSMMDGILFMTTDYFVYEAEHFELLKTINWIILPAFSFLFLVMPWNYIDDPTLSF